MRRTLKAKLLRTMRQWAMWLAWPTVACATVGDPCERAVEAINAADTAQAAQLDALEHPTATDVRKAEQRVAALRKARDAVALQCPGSVAP